MNYPSGMLFFIKTTFLLPWLSPIGPPTFGSHLSIAHAGAWLCVRFVVSCFHYFIPSLFHYFIPSFPPIASKPIFFEMRGENRQDLIFINKAKRAGEKKINKFQEYDVRVNFYQA
jgi:hypothetical protein